MIAASFVVLQLEKELGIIHVQQESAYIGAVTCSVRRAIRWPRKTLKKQEVVITRTPQNINSLESQQQQRQQRQKDNKLKQDILINTRICNEDAAKYSQKPVAAHNKQSVGWVCTYKEKAPQS